MTIVYNTGIPSVREHVENLVPIIKHVVKLLETSLQYSVVIGKKLPHGPKVSSVSGVV